MQTAVVTKGPFTETLGAIGTVVPRPGHVAALAAPQPARITHIYVTAGQHVRQGEPLVELDQTPFRAAAQAAEATLAAAEKANDRQQRLAAEGIVPRKDADQAAADVAKARADASNARRAEQLSVVRSPLGGVVTRMTAVLGATADVAQALVEVADPAALDILLSVTPNDAARLHQGAKVSLTAGQNATGEPIGVGSVIDIGGTVDTASRSVSVRVQAPTTRRPLRISETVYAQVAAAVHANAVIVPLEALLSPQLQAQPLIVAGFGNSPVQRKEFFGAHKDLIHLEQTHWKTRSAQDCLGRKTQFLELSRQGCRNSELLCHGSTASITPLLSYFVDRGEITYLAISMVTFTDAGTLKTSVPPSIVPMGMMPGDGIDSLSCR